MSDSESMKYDKAKKTFFSRVSERTRSKRDAYSEHTYRRSGSQNAAESVARYKLKRSVGKLSGASASRDRAREHKRRKLAAADAGGHIKSFGNKNAPVNVNDSFIRIIDESEFRNNNKGSGSMRGSTTRTLIKGNDNEDSDSEEIQIIDKDEFRSQNSCSMSIIGPSSKGKSKTSIYVLEDASNQRTMESSAGYCESFSPEDASDPASKSFVEIEDDSGDEVHEINDESAEFRAAAFRNQQNRYICKTVGGARKKIPSSAQLSTTRLGEKVNNNEGMSFRNTKMKVDGEGDQLKIVKSSSTNTSKRGRGAFVRQACSAGNSTKKNTAKDSHIKLVERSRLFTDTEVESDEDVDPEEHGIMEIDEDEFRNRKQIVEGHVASTSANKIKTSSYSGSKRKSAPLYAKMSSSSSEFIDSHSSSEINSYGVTNSLPDDDVNSRGNEMDIGVASRTRSKMGSKTKPPQVCNDSPSLPTDSDSDGTYHSADDEDIEVESSDGGIEILGSTAEACHVQNNQSMEVSAEKDEDCSKRVGGAVEHASDQSHIKESNCKQPEPESQKLPSGKIQLSDDASSKPEEEEEEKMQADSMVNCKQPAHESQKIPSRIEQLSDDVSSKPEEEEKANKTREVQEELDQTFCDVAEAEEGLKERNNLQDQSQEGTRRPTMAAEEAAHKKCDLKKRNKLRKTACSSLQQNGSGEVNTAKELHRKEQTQAGVRRSKKADIPSHSKKSYDQSDEEMGRPKTAYHSSCSKTDYGHSDGGMEMPKKADVPSDLKNGYDQSDAGMGGPKKVDLPNHYKDDDDQSDDDDEEDDDIQKTTEANSSGGKPEPYDICSVLADVVLGMGQMPEEDSIKGDKENHEEVPLAPAPQTLPLKFRFEDEVQKPVELTDHEKEIVGLFSELECSWEMDEMKAFEHPQVDLENETSPADETPYERCARGKHELVIEDEEGLICRFCRHVVLGPKDVMPDWVERTYHDSARRRYSETEQDLEFDGVHLQSSVNTIADIEATGTVWSIKAGVRESMYEHQREGFEFLWKNLAGSINLDEVKCGNPSRVGGCIISHAPGTGKTLLTLVFLETYLEVFPKCMPVIVAPASMLLTWEEEFIKWGVKYPLLNLSNPELSAKEKIVCGNHTPSKSRAKYYIRMLKTFYWSKGGCILGISYSLFGKLTGEKYINGNANKKMRQILLEMPGLVILDEGHTPRNQRSNIWNSLLRLKTQKRVILSGTPFQNNFTELFNTLRIVRPAVADVLAQERTYAEMLGTRKRSSARKHSQTPLNTEVVDRLLVKLKSCMEPFVHVHKGNILQQSLPGLRDCVVLLKPSALQKSMIERIEGSNNFKFEHEIALISVHPYLFLHCAEAQMTGIDMEAVGASKLNPLEGVKTRFILELVRLCTTTKEKVLVFSQYIQPLELIKEQLEAIFKWVDGKQILRMKGKLDQKQRQVLIKLFNDPNSESKIMLASTKCCSEGISLVGASRVVLLDVVWNPSVERQAISRAYRIGQKKFVYTYHLMTSGTTEADKYCRQAEKERVSELVFSSANKEKHISLDMEDRILKVMLGKETFKGMFDKIINQPKETDLIESFGLPS